MKPPRTLEEAQAYLKERGLYIIDSDALAGKRPSWGVPGEIPPQPNAGFMQRIVEDDRRGPPATMFGLVKMALGK